MLRIIIGESGHQSRVEFNGEIMPVASVMIRCVGGGEPSMAVINLDCIKAEAEPGKVEFTMIDPLGGRSAQVKSIKRIEFTDGTSFDAEALSKSLERDR